MNNQEAISRQAVLETLDDMDNALDEDRTVENYKELLKECYEVLPSVNPQPCEDAISRQKALLSLTGEDLPKDRDKYIALVNERIKALPPVNPQDPETEIEELDFVQEHKKIPVTLQVQKYCDRNICVSNEYNGIGCDECEVTKSQNLQKSEEVQPKQINDSCLDFDFDKVKEILKKDSLDNLIVDHTCEEKQEQTRDEKMIDAIDFAIKATDSQDDYGIGMRNGMRYVKSLIDGKEPQYELRHTDEEIKLGINLGDEVVGSYGVKGVVVGTDTYNGEVLLSLLMGNHKVPQLVKASRYKTKTGRHFPQIIEVLEQIKEDKE